MACPDPGYAARVSARQGLPVNLCVTFYRNGITTDPCLFTRIDIYRSAVCEENLVAQIPIPPGTGYPAPIEQVLDSFGNPMPGQYCLPFLIPKEFVQDIYFDVWRFIPDVDSNTDVNDESIWLCQASRFWVSPDAWFMDDGLQTIRFGFEPLDLKFRKPEKRVLEVGITPLPLYDFDFNLTMPIIPQLKAYVKVETENCELLVDDEPCAIGLRQGSYRHSPFVVQFLLDTSRFIIGTYRYQIRVDLPNGQSRISEKFTFTVS
jgi:hypothetical protein